MRHTAIMALASAASLGVCLTAAERSRGRLMRSPDGHAAFPGWYYGPENQSQIFNRAEDVPEGWHDHPSKVITPASTGSRPVGQGGAAGVGQDADSKAKEGRGPAAPGDKTNTLDAAGWAWDPKLHAATQSLTNDGLWRMKIGVKRPDPKPGFPKPPLDL